MEDDSVDSPEDLDPFMSNPMMFAPSGSLRSHLTEDGEYVDPVTDEQLIRWVKSCEPVPEGWFVD